MRKFFRRIKKRAVQGKQTVVSISSLAFSGIFTTLITLIGGIIQARYISPESLGYFYKFAILPGYLSFLHIGVFASLQREYPYYLGKKDHEKATGIVRNALGWVWVCQIIFILIMSVFIVNSFIHRDFIAALTWIIQTIIGTMVFYMNYLSSTYRTNSAFIIWSRSQIFASTVSLFLLPAVIFWGYLGFCFRTLSYPLSNAIYAHIYRPVKVKPELNWKIIKSMISFGFPVAVFAYISLQLTETTLRLFILKFCDARTLGLYAFSLPVYGVLSKIAQSFQQVFAPRITQKYGALNDDMAACYRYSLQCMLVSVSSMIVIILVAGIVLEPFLLLVAPRYLDSLPIMRIVMWLALLPALETPKQLLVIAKKVGSFAFTSVIGFILAVVIILLLPAPMRTVTWIVGAFILGKMLNAIATHAAILYNIYRKAAVDARDQCDTTRPE